MTTTNGKTPSKRPSSTDLASRPQKKQSHNEDKFSSTSAKQNTLDPTDHDDPSQNHEKSDSVEGINEWKKRPPYQIHKEEGEFEARYEASCHCGKVTYQLSREEPLDSKLCHCTTCQTQHAAPFQWAAIFHKTDINFTSGHHGLEWYDPSSKSVKHSLPCKVRCSYCHSPIMDEGRNMVLLFPSLVHFKSEEEKEHFKPKCHMFYKERVINIPDGLPKWSGMKDKSELIEDSPEEDVKEYERKKLKEKKEEQENGENSKDD
ncbi:Glutathione-dependent formaldehyde-activating family GFA [Venturia nashicola]|uniref:Glutathione-dependent formaldehyde-activating family GFA n=1 Tax=Venturia nashicola TaxID=86259 RepID=A0A4Z1P7L3_9PEZI|nr:Glutathione-dependent formaldehyde-activating family GFA [Venturia nashicola]TLD35629.1 Glutathione-dependent formaldehyde-activating family GFA [Venturia nashicola]